MALLEHIQEPLPTRPPENFHSPGSSDFLPSRVLKEMVDGRLQDTYRVRTLRELIDRNLLDKSEDMQFSLLNTKKKLFDLVMHNAWGKAFPTPSTTEDFVGVIDHAKAKDGKFRNCIVLTSVRDENGDTKLSLVGGYNQIGEAVTQTAARKTAKKTGAKNITHYTYCFEASEPNRDWRDVNATSVYSGLVDLDELDRSNTYIIPLTGDGDELNQAYFNAGVLTDVTGKQIEHHGMLIDHAILVTRYHKFWLRNSKMRINASGQIERTSLAEAIAEASKTTPQDWFNWEKYIPDKFDRVDVEGGKIVDRKSQNGQMRLTPNILFAVEKAEQIFKAFNVPNPHERAMRFICQCKEDDILPEYPPHAVTVDSILVDTDEMGNDLLIVHQRPNGTLALPGGFYAPEQKDVNDSGLNLTNFARTVLAKKYGVDFRPCADLGTVSGTVALGREADPRYPRVSHVKIGIVTNAYNPEPQGGLEKGSKIVKIKLWKNKEKGELSDEIMNGIDGKGWSYGHNEEIIKPLLSRFFEHNDPARRKLLKELVLSKLD